MKSATLPSLRVEPALRDAAESLLGDGETLSSFVETAVREQVALRRQRETFMPAASCRATTPARPVPTTTLPMSSTSCATCLAKPRRRPAPGTGAAKRHEPTGPLQTIESAMALLATTPFAGRKATDDASLRELVIGFGNGGFAALYEVESPDVATVLAVRHQREDDYW